MNEDTIVAVSTPRGVGGVAMLRLSGSEALPTVLRHLSVKELPPRHAVYCRFDELDDIVAVYYPRGYTGEPTVELTCHGSLFLQEALVQVLINDGIRLAEPGEFTLRAFRNGRLNLSQAEAVADLIDAATPQQHRLAVSQLRGGYAETLKTLRQQLLDLTSLLELELDFSQEDVEFADRTQLNGLISTLLTELSSLIGSFRLGNALKRGIPVAIVGRPNAGKSSLLNALVGDDRAIVSDIPGTTRDTIDELLTIDGLTFRFIDTAGLRHSTDTVEALGIERSLKAVADAQIVLLVHDATTPWQEPDLDLSGKKVIVVLNKTDLLPTTYQPINVSGMPSAQPTTYQRIWYAVGSADNLSTYQPINPSTYLVCRRLSRQPINPSTYQRINLSTYQPINVSTKTFAGIEALKAAMVEAVRQEMGTDSVLVSNERHYAALRRVQEALSQVREGLEAGTPCDLVAVDLRDALYHLGTVTGEVTNNEVLGNIFSRFCIGK